MNEENIHESNPLARIKIAARWLSQNLENDLPKVRTTPSLKARGALVEMSPTTAASIQCCRRAQPGASCANSSRGAEPIRSGADDDDAKQAERLRASVEGVTNKPCR